MNRRRLLAMAAGAPTALVAGCVETARYRALEGREADCSYDSGTLPTVSEFTYPSGASRSGLRTDEIVTNNQNHLERTWGSATLGHRQTRTSEGFERSSEVTAQFEGGDVRIRRTDENGEIRDTWPDGDGNTFVRARRAGSTRYYLSTYNMGPGIAIGELQYDDIVGAGEYEAEEVRRLDGAAVVTYEASSIADRTAAARLGFFDDVDDLSARVNLQCNGIVRKASYDVSGTLFGERQQLEGVSSVSRLGETTVSPPDWLSEARDRAVELRLETASDGSFVSVTVVGGEPIPEGTEASLGVSGRSYEGTTDAALSPGDTVFLWVDDEDLHLTEREPDGATGTVNASRYSLTLRTPDGPRVYRGDFDASS